MVAVEAVDGIERIEAARAAGIRFVQLQFTDIIGHVKAVTIPIHQLEGSVRHGTWFDGCSIEGFTRIAESDQYLMPDMGTFAEIPWQPASGPRGTARVICDVFTPRGEPFVGDPRFVLRRQVERARKLGYIVNTGPELEFFLFRRDEHGEIAPLPHDQAGYFDFSTDLAQEVRQDMVDALEAFGIRVEAAHHEVAAGQHEIDFEYSDALQTADNAITFKFALKAIAQQHGLHATFMPKPIFGINGSGMHTHISLYSIERGVNAFADESNAVWALGDGPRLHGRDPRPRPGHERDPRADRELVQAPHPGLRGADLPHLGPDEPIGAHPRPEGLARQVDGRDAGGGSLPGSVLEHLPRLRRPDRGRPRRRREAASSSAPPVEESLFEMDAARIAEMGIREMPGSLGEALEELERDDGCSRRPRRARLRPFHRGEARRVGRLPPARLPVGTRPLPRSFLELRTGGGTE